MIEAIFAAAVLFGVILYVTRPFWVTMGGVMMSGGGSTGSPRTGIAMDRFCTQCGEKNSKGSRFCGQCGKVLLALLMLFFSTSLFAADAPPGMAAAAGLGPHSKVQVGEIHGTLVKEGKAQGNKQVAIQVLKDGQTLLTLPKQTDEKGNFIFKNIFMDPQFSYVILTEDSGKVYHVGPMTMPAKQDVLNVRFDMKSENADAMNAEPLPPSSPRDMPAETSAPKQWQNQQMTAIILSALVLVLLAYALGRYQRRK